MENYFFLKNYITSEGVVSYNVLYYQPLPITHYQVRFYANNYFEYLPIVSTAFKPEYSLFILHMLRPNFMPYTLLVTDIIAFVYLA